MSFDMSLSMIYAISVFSFFSLLDFSHYNLNFLVAIFFSYFLIKKKMVKEANVSQYQLYFSIRKKKKIQK